MYRLLQVGKLVYKQLINHLVPCSYALVNFTVGLQTNNKLNITFILVVDDFGIKYIDIKNLNYLDIVLENRYAIIINYISSLYISMILK